MGKMISGSEYPLAKIFSEDFSFRIPDYQRPYAWTEEHAATLFDDLLDFYRAEPNDTYFLGSIVLIKDDEKPEADVIDGQQRLTTLSILISSIASKFQGDDRNQLKERLVEPGDKWQGLEASPRLQLRESDQEFFRTYIQDVEIDSLLALDPQQLDDEPKQNIFYNCKVFIDRIDRELDKRELIGFTMFLIQRCYLVAVSTQSRESAYRVFSVLNSRGLDLLPMDIIKADVIGDIDSAKRKSYSKKWENLEITAGRKGFDDVFAHTRTIFTKRKARKSLDYEIKEYVLSTLKSPESFIDDVLVPYTEAYQTIVDEDYAAQNSAEEVNEYLSWLNRINNSDWIPCAIKFFADRKASPEYVLWFTRKLERLASFMHITAKDVNERIARFSTILEEMESSPSHSLSSPLLSVELTPSEKNQFINALNGDIYNMVSKRRNYAVLRLDAIVNSGTTNYDPKSLTIEHVLPQTVKQGSEWATLWPDEIERWNWLHRIANLVPLPRRKNSEAQNYDFAVKKDKYFKSKSKTTTFALTTWVTNEDSWTPEVVQKRQEELMAEFKKEWEL